MWISTQDDEGLLEPRDISVSDKYVRGINSRGDTVILGTYKTKERAIEVRKEIGKHLMNGFEKEEYVYDYQGLESVNRCAIIFEMPKE